MPTMRKKQKAPLAQMLEALKTKPIVSNQESIFHCLTAKDALLSVVCGVGFFPFMALILLAGV